MARGRSTSRARSASRSKRAASFPTKILGMPIKKITAIANEVLAMVTTAYASLLAFGAGNRAAFLGYGALAISAFAVFLNRILTFLPVSKKVNRVVTDFEKLWSYYTGYFGVPLIGYSTLVSLGVIRKVCETTYVSAACTGNGDLVDYLAALFVIFVVTSSVKQVGKFVTAEVVCTAGYALPVFVAAVVNQQRRFAAVAGAYIVLTHFAARIEKKVPFVGKYALLNMATNAANAAVAMYLFQ